MDGLCSVCGSGEDVKTVGDILLCASCLQGESKVAARLKFARWAVEHGVITDFPGRVDELFEHSAKTPGG